MTSVLDDKRRIVLPRDVAEQLGLTEGSRVSFTGDGDSVLVKKIEKTGDPLGEMMS